MGPARAKQAVILAADRISSAREWGLVENVVADGQVLPEALAFAARIAALPLPVTMRTLTALQANAGRAQTAEIHWEHGEALSPAKLL